MQDTATILRERRTALRMTQDQLAGAAGLTRKTVVRAEGGSPISDETLKALCAVLELDSSALSPKTAPGPDAETGIEAQEVEPPPLPLVDMADIPEESRLLVERIAGAIQELAPSATAIAVTDLDPWCRRMHEIYVRRTSIAPRPTDDELKRLDLRGQILLFGASIGLVGPLGLVFAAYLSARGGDGWMSPVIGFLLDIMPPLDTPLAQFLLIMIPLGTLLAAILGGCFLMFHLGEKGQDLGSDVERARMVRANAAKLANRAHLAGPDGLHICQVRDDGSVEVNHITPRMVSACEIRMYSHRPTLVLHLLSGKSTDKEDLAGTYSPYRSTYEIPDIASAPLFIGAMAPFDPAGDALRRTRIARPAGVASLAA